MVDTQTKRVSEHLEDTMLHKQLFLKSCLIMVKYLCQHDQINKAIALAQRASIHDNSKFEEDEISMFASFSKEDHSTPNGVLNESQRKMLVLHWKRNPHHPEYFQSYQEMSEIDVMEMCCDWHARSQQFGDDLLQFVKQKQVKRFGFDEDFTNKVVSICEILVTVSEQLP